MSHSRLDHCLLLHVERSQIYWQGKVFSGCTILDSSCYMSLFGFMPCKQVFKALAYMKCYLPLPEVIEYRLIFAWLHAKV